MIQRVGRSVSALVLLLWMLPFFGGQRTFVVKSLSIQRQTNMEFTHNQESSVALFVRPASQSSTTGEANLYKGCLQSCVCKWKGGKQTAECVNSSLSAIPQLDQETQVLDVSHNYFLMLHKDIFLKLKMPNLQKIFLSHCSLRIVEEHSFR